MADVTFGVKVAPDLKEKIEHMFKASDFDTQKEWFQHLLSVYDLHQLKHQDGTKRFASDLEYIEQNLTRIQDTIVQMMKKTADEVSHQETEWAQSSLIQQEAIEKSEQAHKELASQLVEAQNQVSNYKKDHQEFQKQNNVFEELNSTLKKSLLDKETENTELKNDIARWASANYSETIRRQSEEYQTLQQQYMKLQHQIDLHRMEYEKKLEVAQLKTEFAKKEIEILLSQRKSTQENTNTPSRGRGRPRKDEASLPLSDQLQLSTDDYEDETEDEKDPTYDLPDDADGLHEMLGDEPPPQKTE